MLNKIEFDEVRLAKCQFCGGEAEMIRTADGKFAVMCGGECGYHISEMLTPDMGCNYVYDKTPLRAAQRWNRDYWKSRGQYEEGDVGSEAWEKKEVDA